MDDLQYRISGDDLQFVEIRLPPGGAAVAEPGSMMYVDEGVTVTTVLGDGSGVKRSLFWRMGAALRRSFSGESFFSVVFDNGTTGPRRLAVAAPSPGQIVPIDLQSVGGTLLTQRGAYLCAARGIEVGLVFQKRIRVGLFGGEGFILQKLTGNGTVFVHASGALTALALGPGERLRIDTGCLVALQPSVGYEIQYAGRVKTALFGGEGLFYTQLTGPGTIWLQSMPLKRLSRTLLGALTPTRSGGGRILGALYLLVVFIVVVVSRSGGG